MPRHPSQPRFSIRCISCATLLFWDIFPIRIHRSCPNEEQPLQQSQVQAEVYKLYKVGHTGKGLTLNPRIFGFCVLLKLIKAMKPPCESEASWLLAKTSCLPDVNYPGESSLATIFIRLRMDTRTRLSGISCVHAGSFHTSCPPEWTS